MAQMFSVALNRLANGQHGQIMPVTRSVAGLEHENSPAREVVGYELQWMEGSGVDPTDSILCRYRVKDLVDVERITVAQARKQSLEAMAKSIV